MRESVREQTAAIFILRCCELGITSAQDLDSFDMGMIYDMLIERGNDHVKFNLKPTQQDIEDFWG